MKRNCAPPEYQLAKSLELVLIPPPAEYLKRLDNPKINEIWKKFSKVNGNILNLSEVKAVNGKITLKVHTVEYKHFFAQKNGVDLGLTPVGVSGLTYKSDRKFFLGKRSSTVTQYPGFYEFIPSGSLENLDYHSQLLSELKEELGLTQSDVKEVKPFCLIFDQIDKVYDIGLAIELKPEALGKIHSSEYEELKEFSEEQLKAFFKAEKNIVPTSRILSKAFYEIL